MASTSPSSKHSSSHGVERGQRFSPVEASAAEVSSSSSTTSEEDDEEEERELSDSESEVESEVGEQVCTRFSFLPPLFFLFPFCSFFGLGASRMTS